MNGAWSKLKQSRSKQADLKPEDWPIAMGLQHARGMNGLNQNGYGQPTYSRAKVLVEEKDVKAKAYQPAPTKAPTATRQANQAAWPSHRQ